ncbi:MAG: bifunctional diaminohydroxyphosphoribosylaminopyrimidine deaminase/5-amino-6-(5-phosphoribosylamino)uracil reductase RibD [Adhaeribacter sp.]
MTSTDLLYMRRALELARLGQGSTAPNPLVGCVIVHQDRIIGEGWHRQYGGPHAEVNAIQAVKEKHLLADSRLYVTLEPCSHYGKTPPCADLLLAHKIPDVWVCNTDPNPLVQGRGIRKLLEAGCRVHVGLLEKEGLELNKYFFAFHSLKRPYITLKWAETADGCIGRQDGQQQWISGLLARLLTHQWRASQQAIMVGTRTATSDNPRLNTREWSGPDPLRLVIDRQLQLPGHLRLFDHSQPTLVYNVQKADKAHHLEWVQLRDSPDLMPQILADLYARNIQSVLVEGGAALLGNLLQAGLWDEAYVIKSPRNLEAPGIAAPSLPLANMQHLHHLGGDTLIVYKNTF